MPCKILWPSFAVSGTRYEYSWTQHLQSCFVPTCSNLARIVDLGSRRLSSLRATANVRLVRCPNLAILFVIAFALTANAQSEKIVKVLPHFLDTKGRASISPSLFDRDAYQEVLRTSPKKRSGLRFGVQWKASYFPSLKLRVEAKGGQ